MFPLSFSTNMSPIRMTTKVVVFLFFNRQGDLLSRCIRRNKKNSPASKIEARLSSLLTISWSQLSVCFISLSTSRVDHRRAKAICQEPYASIC
jgi:hypothetical protein